ncbi:MAG: tetratricopeptide repeat protein, partial [Bacteroidales bacterium]|nr:tetratricopeptide repeat protein [Bacteroidales bacterium]
MKRKNFIRKLLGASLCILLLAPAALNAQEKMPITTSSEEARELFIEGRDQTEMLNIAKSTELLQRAVELDPEFAIAYLFLSFSEGGASFAREPLDKAIKFSSKVSEGERQMIHLIKAMRAGNERAAEIHRQALLKLHPQDKRVQLWSGYSFYFQEEYRKALTHFKKAKRLNESFHLAYNILGYTYMNLEKPEKAEEYFKAYLRMLPDAANPHDSYAEFLRKQGRFDEAIEHYKKAIAYSPGFLASHKGLADSYLFKGEYGLAREQYQNYYKRLSSNYSKFNALFLEASVDLHENNLEAAMKTMDKYTDLAEEWDLSFYKIFGEIYKGYILCERGKTEDGWKHYSKAIYMMKEVGLGENTNENTENL